MMMFRPLKSPMKYRCRFSAVTLLLGLVLCLAGGASAQPQTGTPPQIDMAVLAQIQSYLNGVATVRAKFIQTTSQGGFAEGALILARPGGMKIAYAPPAQLEIYADGTWLIYVDYELKEVNQLPIAATPAAVLLREKIDFQKDVTVASLENRDTSWRLHLREAGEEGSGTLILAFAKAPLSLTGWAVIDAQQVTTSVRLIEPLFNAPVGPRELIFYRPDWTDPGTGN